MNETLFLCDDDTLKKWEEEEKERMREKSGRYVKYSLLGLTYTMSKVLLTQEMGIFDFSIFLLSWGTALYASMIYPDERSYYENKSLRKRRRKYEWG